MMDLTPDEHQKLVLMCGSKKDWQTYLGLDDSTARSTWTSLALKSPADYVRSLSRETILLGLARHGSTAKTATHLGVSESFLTNDLRTRFREISPVVLIWTVVECVESFEKYRSVKLVSRMTGATETQIRKKVEELGLELTQLIDYSFGGNSNAKGRRAELDYAKRREGNILEDKNLTEGSQANWDFDDAKYGRVNVKSSRRYKFKAKTRKDSPHFWKLSCGGIEKCDFIACLLYDDQMNILLGVKMIASKDMPATKSLVLLERDIDLIR